MKLTARKPPYVLPTVPTRQNSSGDTRRKQCFFPLLTLPTTGRVPGGCVWLLASLLPSLGGLVCLGEGSGHSGNSAASSVPPPGRWWQQEAHVPAHVFMGCVSQMGE